MFESRDPRTIDEINDTCVSYANYLKLWIEWIDYLIYPDEPMRCYLSHRDEGVMASYNHDKHRYHAQIPKLRHNTKMEHELLITRIDFMPKFNPKRILFAIACHEVRHRTQRIIKIPSLPSMFFAIEDRHFHAIMLATIINLRENNKIGDDEIDALIIETLALLSYQKNISDIKIRQIVLFGIKPSKLI